MGCIVCVVVDTGGIPTADDADGNDDVDGDCDGAADGDCDAADGGVDGDGDCDASCSLLVGTTVNIIGL